MNPLDPQLSARPLGFGLTFSPWMVRAEWSAASGWSELSAGPMAPLQLHPAAGVLQYAQTIFEGMKAFRQGDGKVRLFRPEFHQQRFAQSAQRICLPVVPPELFDQAVHRVTRLNHETVPSGEGEALYLRPTLIGSEGFLGVRPSTEAIFYVIASPVGSYFSSNAPGLRICIETHYSRVAPGGIGSAKAGGNYAASLLAAQEAKQKGFDQVLWTDSSTHTLVEEVGTMNVFFVIGDKIVTPPLGDTLLDGGTRDSAIQLLRHQGVAVEERPISLAELQQANADGLLHESFGTGTAAIVSPIQEFQDSDGGLHIQLSGDSVRARQLRRDLLDIHYGRVADPFGWGVDVR